MNKDKYKYVSLTTLTDMVRSLSQRMVNVEERDTHVERIDKLEERMAIVEEDLFYHKGILTMKEVQKLLNICESELYRMSREHGLPFRSVSKRKRVYLIDDIIEWLDKHPEFSGNNPFKKKKK